MSDTIILSEYNVQYVWQSVLFPSFTERFQAMVVFADYVTSQPNTMLSLLFLPMNIEEVYLEIIVRGRILYAL